MTLPMAARRDPFRRAAAVLLAAALLAGCDRPASPAQPTPRTLATAQDTTLYAMGQGLANQFNLLGLFTLEELALINHGFNDAVMDKEALKLEDHLGAMNAMIQGRRQARAERLQQEGDGFVQQQAAAPGAVQTASGLVYVERAAGTGRTPGDSDSVTVHYEGAFSDGTVFDSSLRRGEPAGFTVNRVIAGWREGLTMMKEGGKAKLVVPARLGYGERGYPPAIPPNVPLVFEVELIKVHTP